MRWWYLRRGVAWPALLGCATAAAVLAGALERWPSSALVLLPAMLGCCAASASFVFDEGAGAVVAVTPRGAGWRRTTRLLVVGVPLAAWGLVVSLRPGDLPLHRGGWWLAGAAAILLASGVAAGAARERPSPGRLLASVVVLAAISPVVVCGFLGWPTVYPVAGFGSGAWTTWAVVAVAGTVAWLVASLRGA